MIGFPVFVLLVESCRFLFRVLLQCWGGHSDACPHRMGFAAGLGRASGRSALEGVAFAPNDAKSRTRRCSEREPADSLRDKSNVIGGWLPSLTFSYWNSDPRPRLTLYQGGSSSEDTDHFLGQFEVLDLPASNNLNVSTLCVVSNGQIILCSRDNHRDKFLEIRRVEAEGAK